MGMTRCLLLVLVILQAYRRRVRSEEFWGLDTKRTLPLGEDSLTTQDFAGEEAEMEDWVCL